MIPDIESFRLVPHMTNIIECLKIPNLSHDPYGRGPEMALLHIGWRGKLRGVSGDISEYCRSGITLLGITSLNRHFYAQIDWTKILIIATNVQVARTFYKGSILSQCTRN